MELKGIVETLARGDLSAVDGVAVLTLVLLLVALRWLLPRGQRRRLVTPLVLLVMHVALVALALALPQNAPGRHFVALTGLLLILAAAGRIVVLLLLHSRVLAHYIRIPKIFGDIIQGLVYAAAALITLNVAGVETGSLLTTSALLTAVIGLSLQDTLGNLFSGLAIQAQRPFDIGDWIQFDERPDHLGEVTDINWRAVTLRTIEHIEVTVPNGMLAKAAIRNFSKPERVVRRDAYVTAPYDVPPRRVERVLLESVKDVPGVLASPPSSVITDEFTERGVKYQIRFFIEDVARRDVIEAQVVERAWYALQRAGVEIPPPLRDVSVHEVSAESEELKRMANLAEREQSVRCVDLFRVLPEKAQKQLAQLSSRRLYAAGERIICQGDEGDEMFVVEEGEVQVLLERDGEPPAVVACLGTGKFFGEMSLVTGTRRAATVVALRDSVLLTIGKHAFQQVLAPTPEVVEKVSAVLGRRTERLEEFASNIDSIPPPGSEEREGMLLNRIKKFLSL